MADWDDGYITDVPYASAGGHHRKVRAGLDRKPPRRF